MKANDLERSRLKTEVENLLQADTARAWRLVEIMRELDVPSGSSLIREAIGELIDGQRARFTVNQKFQAVPPAKNA